MIRFTPPIVSTEALSGLMLVLSAGHRRRPIQCRLLQLRLHRACNRQEIPSIEGRDGVFYRINADLRMDPPVSDQTVAQIAGLSQALAVNGTTLIFVPIPTKSVTMPGYLPIDLELTVSILKWRPKSTSTSCAAWTRRRSLQWMPAPR